ncbi:MAG: N-acetyltransferase family protein [Limnohabitans sp.]
MSSSDIRYARLEDAAAVANLHLIASRTLHEGVVPDAHWQTTPPAQRVAFWKEAIEYGEPQVMVATQGGEIVGFAGFDRSRDPKSKNTTGELWAMYVDPDHLGQGVGLALWDAAREGLQDEGCTEVTVWVPLSSTRALAFFDAAGFKREMNTARTVPMGGVRVEEIRFKRSLA